MERRMTQNDLALHIIGTVIAMETARRFNSHVLTDEEVIFIVQESKRLTKIIAKELKNKDH